MYRMTLKTVQSALRNCTGEISMYLVESRKFRTIPLKKPSRIVPFRFPNGATSKRLVYISPAQAH